MLPLLLARPVLVLVRIQDSGTKPRTQNLMPLAALNTVGLVVSFFSCILGAFVFLLSVL